MLNYAFIAIRKKMAATRQVTGINDYWWLYRIATAYNFSEASLIMIACTMLKLRSLKFHKHKRLFNFSNLIHAKHYKPQNGREGKLKDAACSYGLMLLGYGSRNTQNISRTCKHARMPVSLYSSGKGNGTIHLEYSAPVQRSCHYIGRRDGEFYGCQF